jgi:hypothetical protein
MAAFGSTSAIADDTIIRRKSVCSTHSPLLKLPIRPNVGNRAQRTSALQRERSVVVI